MVNDITAHFIQVAKSIDHLIGKGKVVDADFTDYDPSPLDIDDIYRRMEEIRALNKSTPNIFPFYKQEYLEKQLKALEIQLDIFKDPDLFQDRYIEVGETYLDVKFPPPDYELISVLKDRIAELISIQKLSGSLSKQVQCWKDKNRCSHAEYMHYVEKYAGEFCRLSFENILPFMLDDNQIAFINSRNSLKLSLVDTTESWSAYNYYKGNFSGNVVFNKAGAFDRNGVRQFVSHEAYPGHHTSGLIKEYYTRQISKDAYLGLQFLNAPSCLIEEGIADTGLELLGITPDSFDENLSYLLDELNANVIYLVAYKLFVEGIDEAEGIRLLKQEKLMEDDDQVLRGFNFIKSWKYYVPAYKLGRDFVRKQMTRFENKKKLIQLLYLCPSPMVINNYVENN